MSSEANSSQWKSVVDKFLEDYKKPETQARYQKLASHTGSKCEALLKGAGVKGVVSNRTKDCSSLRKKLFEMTQVTKKSDGATKKQIADFRDWVADRKNDIREHPEFGDLAGVRIGLYLPDDVVKVAKEVEKHFDKQHLFGTVTGERNTTKGRNLDVEQHGNGPWQTKDLKGDIEHWQHYGYKSWQIVVQWKARSDLPEGSKRLRVEIQVGTLVTQAWAEVQHDIIYKRPAEILATPTMKRAIDAINGLAITTEIMLVELARSLEIAEREAIQPFTSGEEFWRWFQSAYRDQMQPEERNRWICYEVFNDMLVKSSNGAPSGSLILKHTKPEEVHRVTPCRAEFIKLIEEKDLLAQPSKENGQTHDISRLLLEALGYKLHHSPFDMYLKLGPA